MSISPLEACSKGTIVDFRKARFKPGSRFLQLKKGLSMYAGNGEQRRTQRIGWLRAAVLGANDDILSASTLVLGVAAAHAIHRNILVAGVAALVAGAMSMAAGEYVSVHSQAENRSGQSFI
jgi:VIT1/CCC1 family predicted Fe2+/Mn2+ transporter